MSSHAWCGTCCLIYLLCRVYKRVFFLSLSPFMFCFFLKSFFVLFLFIHCTPHRFPVLQSVFSQIKKKTKRKKKTLYSFGCCEHGRPGARPDSVGAFFHDVPMCHVESMETCIHSDSGAGRVEEEEDDGCEFVCRRHQFVSGLISFHKALPYIYYS